MANTPKEKSSSLKRAKPGKSKRVKAGISARASLTIAHPTYADVVKMLDTLVPANDQNIFGAPHSAFWRGINRNDFVNHDVSGWTGGQVTGPLVTPGNPDTSPFYLALAGKPPFDGTSVVQMPDTNADPNANPATPDDLTLVATWIRNGAPA